MSAKAASAPQSPVDPAARPEVFLFPSWRGQGIYCDAFGVPNGRYEIWGHGETQADGSVVIEMNTRLDIGTSNHFEWVISPSSELRFPLYDRVTGQQASGVITATGFGWSWNLLHRTPLGVRRCRVEGMFNLRGPAEASTSTTMTLWGVAVGSSSSHIRHLR